MNDDLISRQATIDALDAIEQNYNLAKEFVKGVISELPSAEPKKGCWLDALDEDPCYYRCSECGRLSGFSENFCPNCGADMRGEEE